MRVVQHPPLQNQKRKMAASYLEAVFDAAPVNGTF